jgi:hypothetical protein
MAVPLDDVPEHSAWMKMPACLLAWFKTDFPHIDRGNISSAQNRSQQLFPLDRLLAHVHTMLTQSLWSRPTQTPLGFVGGRIEEGAAIKPR